MSRRPDPLTPWYDILRPEGPIYAQEEAARYVNRSVVEAQIWTLAADRTDRKPVLLVGGRGWGRTALLSYLFHQEGGQRWEYTMDKLDRVAQTLTVFTSVTNLKKNRRRVGALTEERLTEAGWDPSLYHRVDLPKPDAAFLQQILFLRLGVCSFPGDEQRAVHRLGVKVADGNIRTYLRFWRDAGSYAYFRAGDPWPSLDDGKAAAALDASMKQQAESRRRHQEALASERKAGSLTDDTDEDT